MSKANLSKLALIALLAGAALVVGLLQRSPHPLQVGEPAPNFTLTSLTGSSISLRDYRHRVVIVNFWATWCPPCVTEMPSLEKLAQQMHDREVVVVAISVDEDVAVLERFVAAQRLSFPIGHDPERVVPTRYGTFKFPETYIIDRQGKLVQKIVGAVDWQDPRIIEFVKRLAGASHTVP